MSVELIAATARISVSCVRTATLPVYVTGFAVTTTSSSAKIAFAIGQPRGATAASPRLVSGKRKAAATPRHEPHRTDLGRDHPWLVGGGLFDAHGHLVGVTSFVSATAATSASPSD